MKPSNGRNLANIRSSASTLRVWNLVYLAERYHDCDAFHSYPLFQNERLNRAFIIKHAPRPYERDLFGRYTSCATKIIFPFDTNELQLGGRAVFFEEENAIKKLAGFLDVDHRSEEFQSDVALLQEISKLPSIDPYLLRERFDTMGFKVAREYFTISDSDVEKISRITHEQLGRIVRLAYVDSPGRLGMMTERLNQLFLNRESDESLKPLTMAIGLPPEKHHETMFSWKGFIYYKWRMDDVMKRLPRVVGQLKALRLNNPTPRDQEDLEEMKERILIALEDALRRIKTSLSVYDVSYEKMVNSQHPIAFQKFLLSAPDAFEAIGDALSKVSHIATFWEFRFSNQSRIVLDYTDAIDILEEFANQLNTYSIETKRLPQWA